MRTPLLVSALLAALTFSATAQNSFELLFSDSFDVSANSNDVNFEHNAGRQAGLAAPLLYSDSAGPANPLTQVNNPDAPGRLRLSTATGANFVSVSPNHNFTQGGEFVIEFDVDAGLNDPGGASSDWAAIVFGSTRQNVFVNGSDGMGILFRNNGEIEVWDGGARAYAGPGEFPGGIPKESIHVRIEVTAANFSGSPATIRMFIDGTEVRIGSGAGFEHVKAAGFGGNYISLMGYGTSWIHTFDNFSISAVTCINPSTYALSSVPGQTNQVVSISIPSRLNELEPVQVTVTSAHPWVAEPLGASGGALTLTFPAGGPTVQTFAVAARGKGSTVLSISSDRDACVGGNIAVRVAQTFVRNPSFEANSLPAFPGYGPIHFWEGGSGVNDGTQPFADNGVIPDRAQIAFLQENQNLSQLIDGLDATKQYAVQFYYNARNCCGGTIHLDVRFGGVSLISIPNVVPVGGSNPYNFRHVLLPPGVSSGRLAFVTTASGDATLLLDAVNIVEHEPDSVVIRNPSFEASGVVALPGALKPAPIAGWRWNGGPGTYGVTSSGPESLADNGVNPDQDHVAFISGEGALSQVIEGLEPGRRYRLSYAYNAAEDTWPTLTVSLGDPVTGIVVQNEPVFAIGGNEPFLRHEFIFTAPAGSLELIFAQTDDFGQTVVLLDDVRLVALPALPPSLTIRRFSADTVRIAWPSSFTGYALQSAGTLPGTWTELGLPTFEAEGEIFVIDGIEPGGKYYRLIK
jgi:hypothetical protein